VSVEKIGSCLLHRHDSGKLSLTFYDFDATVPLFVERGHEGGGYSWEGVVRAALTEYSPQTLTRIRFDPEGSMFCAYGDDIEALTAVAGCINELVADPVSLIRAIERAESDDLFDD
jgi:hypothetical protein